MRESTLELPTGYYLERDPDVLVLRRLDGAMVGAFSAHGAAPEALRRIVQEIAHQEPWEPNAPRPETQAPRQHSPAGPTLEVRFFGHFEMLCDGVSVPLGRNGKALTILKYLLAHRSRPVSQDHLMGWLWPESNLKKARWSLNSAVHGLRKLLSRCPISSAVYVLLEEGHYRLFQGVDVSTDVDEFDARYERGRRLEAAGRAQETAVEYERAVELYRGITSWGISTRTGRWWSASGSPTPTWTCWGGWPNTTSSRGCPRRA